MKRTGLIAKILLTVALAATCMAFHRYSPVINDDYINAGASVEQSRLAPSWTSQVRPEWIITKKPIESISKYVFSHRNNSGAHVLASYAPISIFTFLVLRNKAQRRTGLGSIAIYIAIHSTGYDHTSELSYPYIFSFALSLAILLGMLTGKAISKSKGEKAHLLIAYKWILVILATLACLVYETYGAAYAIIGIYSYRSEIRKEYGTSKQQKSSKLTNSKNFVLLFIPILALSLSKIIAIAINKYLPNQLFPSVDFGTYAGTTISTGVGLIEFVKYSAKTLFTLISMTANSTIFNHLERPMTYYNQINSYSINSSTAIAYQTLIAIAVFTTLIHTLYTEEKQVNSGWAPQKYLKKDESWKVSLLIFLALNATSLSSKYQTIAITDSIANGHSYLSTFQSLPFLCYTVSAGILYLLRRIRENKNKNLFAYAFAIIFGVIGWANAGHTLWISKDIESREAVLKQWSTYCQKRKNKKNLMQDIMWKDFLTFRLPYMRPLTEDCKVINSDIYKRLYGSKEKGNARYFEINKIVKNPNMLPNNGKYCNSPGIFPVEGWQHCTKSEAGMISLTKNGNKAIVGLETDKNNKYFITIIHRNDIQKEKKYFIDAVTYKNNGKIEFLKQRKNSEEIISVIDKVRKQNINVATIFEPGIGYTRLEIRTTNQKAGGNWISGLNKLITQEKDTIGIKIIKKQSLESTLSHGELQ